MTALHFRHSLLVFLVALAANMASAGETTESNRRFYATVGTGVDFNRGDFGDRDADGDSINTNTVSIPFFVKLEWEPVTFRASVALLYIDGSDQVSGGGEESGDGENAEQRTSYGVGDVTTSLTYTYYPESASSLPIIDLIAKVKIHSSAPDDLGSSGTDLTLGTELAKTFGPVNVFGGVSYRIRTGKVFDNIWLASFGTSLRIADSIRVGATYDFREASIGGSTDSQEVSPFVSFRTSEHVRLTPYGVIGLSDGAPDWGAGTSVSYQF